MRTSRTVLALLLLIVLAPQIGAASDSLQSEAVAEAVEASSEWLDIIDSEQHGESWEQSAAVFRNAVTRQQWEQALTASRTPLGAMVSRKVKSTQYATSLPGAPDGEYVVIQFETSFENKQSAIETVTPMRDPDGVWRVSGYYIR